MKITPDQWPVFSSLVDDVLALPLTERESWLESLSGPRAALKDKLCAFLAREAQIEMSDFLGTLPKLAAETVRSEPEAAAGAVVGAYVIDSELGRGGMGVVYRAHRADGLLKRPVALKILRSGMQSREQLDRFARERDILAGLVHPNIARLYDAGTSDSGQPYLALEYVEGASLTDFCDRDQSTVRRRLELFLQVLTAVQYAHSRLVIHRDLKPSNILVTLDGQVALLDFGIAKLVTTDAPEASELTLLGAQAMTPEYAAPEQIQGQPVTTAADLYSLGVVLHKLLTGRSPYPPACRSRRALEEAILVTDPPSPSEVLYAADAAANRGTTSRGLKRLLAGDLDAITLKALRKRTEDRYATADAFAQDITRHLRGDPVLARVPGTWYRLRKLIARNQVATFAIAALVVSLAAGMTFGLWEAHAALQQAEVAKREAGRASAVQNFLLDIFRANSDSNQDPLKSRSTTARELLDIGTQRALSDPTAPPDVLETVLGTLSDMYGELGLESEAAHLSLQRIEALKKAYGERDPRVADEEISAAEFAFPEGDMPAALRHLRAATAILDAAGDTASSVRGRELMDSARFQVAVQPAAARDAADAACEFFRRLHPDDEALARALSWAGRARYWLGDYAGAESLYVQALAQTRRVAPTYLQGSLTHSLGLAETQFAIGKIDQAEALMRATLAESIHRNGALHMDTVHTETRLGAVLHSTSRRVEGRQLLQNAAAKVQKESGLDSLNLQLPVYRNLGLAQLADGRLEQAEKPLAQSLALNRQIESPARLAWALDDEAALYTELGRFAEAQRLLGEASATWQRIAGDSADPATFNRFHLDLGNLLLARGDPDAALESFLRVSAPRDVGLMPLNIDAMRAAIGLANTYLQLGRSAEAQELAQMTTDTLAHSPVRSYYQDLESDALLVLGRAQLHGVPAQSVCTVLDRARELRAAIDDPGSPRLAATEVTLAECVLARGDRVRARHLFAQARSIDASHRELGAQYTRPLRELETHLQGRSGAFTGKSKSSPVERR